MISVAVSDTGSLDSETSMVYRLGMALGDGDPQALNPRYLLTSREEHGQLLCPHQQEK